MHLLGIDCIYFEPQHIHPDPQSKLQESTVSTIFWGQCSEHLSLPVLPPVVNNSTGFYETTCSSQPLTQNYLQDHSPNYFSTKFSSKEQTHCPKKEKEQTQTESWAMLWKLIFFSIKTIKPYYY